MMGNKGLPRKRSKTTTTSRIIAFVATAAFLPLLSIYVLHLHLLQSVIFGDINSPIVTEELNKPQYAKPLREEVPIVPLRTNPEQPPNVPPPPKTTLLPKRVIAVYGREPSSSAFLSKTLGIATGAFAEEGAWNYVPDRETSQVSDGEPKVPTVRGRYSIYHCRMIITVIRRWTA